MQTEPTILWEVKRDECERDRMVRKYSNGVIEVVRSYGGGESWIRYVCVPRKLVLATLRRLGRRVARWELYPDVAIRPGYYSGPGRSFAKSSFIYKRNRKYIVFAQGGGLDI